MNRRVIAVSICTLLAVVVATVWVPTRTRSVPYRILNRRSANTPAFGPFYDDLADGDFRSRAAAYRSDPVQYRLIWNTEFGEPDDRAPIKFDHVECRLWEGHTPWFRQFLAVERFALTHALILAIGGLLALFLRTRQARRAAA